MQYYLSLAAGNHACLGYGTCRSGLGTAKRTCTLDGKDRVCDRLCAELSAYRSGREIFGESRIHGDDLFGIAATSDFHTKPLNPRASLSGDDDPVWLNRLALLESRYKTMRR